MSDHPKRQDLFKPCSHDEEYDPHWTEDDDECPGWFTVTDAEFDAIVDADPRWIRANEVDDLLDAEIESQVAERDRHWVQVTQDCPMCFGTTCHQTNPEKCGGCCPNCGRSGKVKVSGNMGATMSDRNVDWDNDEPIVESLMNRIAEMERLWVKVWEDCPTSDHREHLGDPCICDGSGKVLAEGIVRRSTVYTHMFGPRDYLEEIDVTEPGDYLIVKVSGDEL